MELDLFFFISISPIVLNVVVKILLLLITNLCTRKKFIRKKFIRKRFIRKNTRVCWVLSAREFDYEFCVVPFRSSVDYFFCICLF